MDSTFDYRAGASAIPLNARRKLPEHYTTSGPVDVVNTKRAIQITGYAMRENTVVYGARSWWLRELTFHHGSESRIDGTEYPLEVQLLHHDDHAHRLT